MMPKLALHSHDVATSIVRNLHSSVERLRNISSRFHAFDAEQLVTLSAEIPTLVLVNYFDRS